MASRHVRHLEDRVGTRLLNRDSRHVSITEAGELYLDRARQSLDVLDQAEATLTSAAVNPMGTLRISAPMWFADTRFSAIIAEFAALYPDVRFDVDLSGREPNLVEEGFDLAFRATTADSLDPGLIVRALVEMPLKLVACPGSCQTKIAEQVRGCQAGRMALPEPSPFRYFNSSPEVIRLAVMMYVKYPLSLRNVEDLLAERGIDISHETVRIWWNRFGPLFAAEVRKRRVSTMRQFRHWRWHLDEMVVRVNGEHRYLWRAVDHEGEVLESYVTKRRDRKAALRFMRRTLKRHGSPAMIITDGLRSYGAAMIALGNPDKQRVGRWANNRVENSHLPFRRRERAMLSFRKQKTLQKFASIHADVHNHFNVERHLIDRQTFKQRRTAAMAEWQRLPA